MLPTTHFHLRPNLRISAAIHLLPFHSFFCLTTGPQPLPNRVLHTLRSSVSSFKLQYPFFCLRSPSSCLLLLPRLPVTSVLPSIFPPITCFRRQFLCKMWPIQLAFIFIVYRIFLSCLIVCITSSIVTWSVKLILYPSPAPHFKTFQLLCSKYSTVLVSSLNLELPAPPTWRLNDVNRYSFIFYFTDLALARFKYTRSLYLPQQWSVSVTELPAIKKQGDVTSKNREDNGGYSLIISFAWHRPHVFVLLLIRYATKIQRFFLLAPHVIEILSSKPYTCSAVSDLEMDFYLFLPSPYFNITIKFSSYSTL